MNPREYIKVGFVWGRYYVIDFDRVMNLDNFNRFVNNE